MKKDDTPVGNLHLTKKAEITGAALSGAVFGIYDDSAGTKITEITTGNDGTAVCKLPVGSYYLLEQKAPPGYVVEASRIPFVITDGGAVKVEVTNMTERGGVRLIVKDTGGSAIQGAVFCVYNANDVKVAEIASGKDGMTLHELSSGVYHMRAVKPPNGYVAGNERYSFYVSSGQTVDVLVVMQRVSIPKTGETFPWLNYGIAVLCVYLAVKGGIRVLRLCIKKKN